MEASFIRPVFVACFVALAASLAGCASDANCAVCGTAFSNNDCQQIATASGCTMGTAVADPQCGGATMGCHFTGCTGGRPMCLNYTPADTGAGTDAATE
jgi:hypothetical protein